ncbi:MAG: hypothetical protein Q4D31_08015 [Eubacteriales bacterium]|nr:hypothetical protein [Eubacteriales bacterium]
MEQQQHTKRVSADIPFSFLNAMGHSTRAMERFFDLPRETRDTLTDTVSVADDPDARAARALASLADGGEGYCEPF